MTALVTHQVARSARTLCERPRTGRTGRRRGAAHDSALLNGGEWLLLTTLVIGACSTAPSATAPHSPASSVSLNVAAGEAQHAPVNTTLPQAVRVQVLDNSGHPVPNFLLNFVVTSGGGHVFGGVEQTNSSGYADEQWTLGPRLGPQTLEAREVNSWSGVAASYGEFTATGTPPNDVLVVTTSGPTGLAVMNADGSSMHPINVGTLQATNPALSPDHRRVLFDVQPSNIDAVNVDGTGLGVLSVDGHDPMWSPDNVDYLWQFGNGTTERTFTTNGYTSDYSNCTAQWSYSGDGAKLTYVSLPSCPDTAAGVYVLTLGLPTPTLVLAGGTDPAWSPDGEHIAATYNGHTVVMDADGNNLKQTGGAFGRVTWSADAQLWAVDSGYVNTDGTDYVAVKGCPCRFAWK